MDLTPAEKSALWRAGKLRWKLHSGQQIIYDRIRDLPQSTREALIFCSRRYGKSFLGLIMAIEDCLQTPRQNIAFIGPSIKQTLEIIRLIIPKITVDMPSGLMKPNRSEYKWYFSNGSQLMIGGFDTASDSIRGLDIQAVYMEESAFGDMNTFEDVVYESIFPTLMTSQGRMIHLTTPAKLPDHPLHTKTIPKTILSNSYFKFTIQDNPLLTPEVIASEIENLGGIDSERTRRELFCEIVRDGTLTVAPQFSESRHVKEASLPDDAHFWLGGDIGGSRDKSVMLLCAFDYSTDKIHIVNERVFNPQTPSTVIVKETLEMEGGRKLYRAVDAPGQLLVDFGTTHNYSCQLPDKLKFDQNIDRLHLAFYHDQVIIDPKCQFLIYSLNNGQLNKQRNDFARSEIAGHCDAIAALVYALRYADKRVPPKPRDPNKFNVVRDVLGHTETTQSRGIAALTWGGSNNNTDRW